MPMDQKRAYINDTYITFESPEFLATAIYIKDFIHYLLTCIKEKHLPEKITIQSSRNVESGEVLLDKSVYIQDNIPIEKTVNKVRNHYEQFKARSEEHTSELQSRGHLVCRLLLEKKK